MEIVLNGLKFQNLNLNKSRILALVSYSLWVRNSTSSLGDTSVTVVSSSLNSNSHQIKMKNDENQGIVISLTDLVSQFFWGI